MYSIYMLKTPTHWRKKETKEDLIKETLATMFVEDGKSQYSKDVNSPQIDLQMSCNYYPRRTS